MKYVAHIVLEADSVLKIGSGDIDFILDMPVLRDFNDLPFIQGTTLSGIIRKEFDQKRAREIFGYEDKNDGMASNIVISNALLLDENNLVQEELLINKSQFLSLFDELLIREHTAINEKGVAKDKSKFDEEVVYKGSKFKFAIESENKDYFFEVLNKLSNPVLRLGGGSRKGYGKFKIEDIEYECMDENRYAKYSASLNEKLANKYKLADTNENITHIQVKLQPESTYIFGSGFGDKDCDMIYTTETTIDYKNKKLSEEKILIPASSIKGALRQRTLFYLKNKDEIYKLFGAKKGDKFESRGNIIISDVYLKKSNEKKFNHVKIDRFTGGAVNGALYNEKVSLSEEFILDIYILKIYDEVYKAFIEALQDLINGFLLLGGNSLKGHGSFKGEIFINGEKYEA